MIRVLAGVLERRAGAAGERVEDRLRRVTGDGAVVVRAGSLVLACTGPAPVRDGEALCALDGVLDAPVRCGPDDVQPAAAAEAAALAAWRRGGDGALAALRGDFALVLWDGRRGVLARDHLGLRGLFAADDGVVLRFASEPHLVAALLPSRPGPDPVGLAHWLALSAPPADRTLLDGVRKVPPAGVLDLDPEQPRPARRHWDPVPRTPDPVDAGEAAARLRAGLAQAVERRAAGPDEGAVLLSGGLDSASVAGVARGLLDPGRAPQRAYSAVFPVHRSVDESALIARLRGDLGLRGVEAAVHHAALLPGVLPFLERYALPPVSPNLFFWEPLHARAAADGTRILLDGEGGDELYGLSPYLLSDLLRRGRVRGAADLVHRIPGAHRGISHRTVGRWLARTGLEGLAPAWVHGASRRLRPGHARPVDFLRPATGAAYDATAPGGAWKRSDGPRWWAFLVHAVTRIGPSLAYDHGRRRAAMAGILPRHPLVDVDLVELVLSLPPGLAFDPHRSRPVLRAAVEGLVPDEVRLRPSKSTFDEVFHAALAGTELPAARALLGPGALVGEHVDLALVDRMLEGAPSGFAERQWWALRVWRLVTAECFLRHLADTNEPRRTLERLGLDAPDVRLSTR